VPAAAVIPAPIAYIKVVAVKKLVVGFWVRLAGPGNQCTGRANLSSWEPCSHFTGRARCSKTFTVKKLECLKQASA
jgi:hypothetical protein